MTQDNRITELEIQLSHLQKVVEDLSDVISRQDGQITLLERRVTLLMRRASEAEADQSGGIPLADQKPPHW